MGMCAGLRLPAAAIGADADVRGAVGDEHDRSGRPLAADLRNALQLVHRGEDRLADRGAAAELTWRLSASSVSAWSALGDCSTLGCRANTSIPTSTVPGTLATNRFAGTPRRALAGGRTSVALIEPETSLASMTAPLVTGSATLRCGRAAATISSASASTNDGHRHVSAPARTPRRHRGRSGSATNAAPRGTAALLAGVPRDQQRNRDQPEEDDRIREAHGAPAGRTPRITSVA